MPNPLAEDEQEDSLLMESAGHKEAQKEITDFMMYLCEKHGWHFPETLGVFELWKISFCSHIHNWSKTHGQG